MKKLVLSVLGIYIAVYSFSQGNFATDAEAIKDVITKAYVEGIQNRGDIAEISKGFHPGFNLLIPQDEMLTELPIYNWIERVKKVKEEKPKPLSEEQKTTCEFLNIDITGTAAVAKIRLSRNNKPIYVDYLSLYKFKEGWKIVNKIYYRVSHESE